MNKVCGTVDQWMNQKENKVYGAADQRADKKRIKSADLPVNGWIINRILVKIKAEVRLSAI